MGLLGLGDTRQNILVVVMFFDSKGVGGFIFPTLIIYPIRLVKEINLAKGNPACQVLDNDCLMVVVECPDQNWQAAEERATGLE